jgi:ubiquinol oxidase
VARRYETFGWWRAPGLRMVHNSEEWNELHHLLIMESLGGNTVWSDRFLGYHASILYYWLLIVT